MKLYKRIDFLKLAEGTIYSRVDQSVDVLMFGLFSKGFGGDWQNDWIEQDLISEGGFPDGTSDGIEALDYQINLRDTFQEFQTDLNCAGRDGTFDESDVFVVWDKKDVTKLIDYLTQAIK